MKVSVVIRTYNEQKHIKKLLTRVYAQDFPADQFEVIVVDSGSTDRTLEIVKSFHAKLVQIKSEDFTFGYSLNKGIEVAKGDYILMTSAHCYPMNCHWMKRMIAPFEKNENVAVVYGKQRGYGTTKFSEHQIFRNWYPDRGGGIQKNPFCNNANCAIRRDLWEKRKYDEKLTGLEDLDFANAMQQLMYDVYYQPSAGVYHIHAETYKQIYNRYKREAIALKNIINDTKFTVLDFILLFGSNFFNDLYIAYKQKKNIKVVGEIFMFRLCQFFGTYMGNHYKKQITNELKKKFYYPSKLGR